jgi:sporulation protein YunB
MFKKRYILVLLLLIGVISLSVSYLGKLIENKISKYVYDEVNKTSKMLIRDILNEKFISNLDLDSLFVVEKNSLGEIVLIDFDVTKVNMILGLVSDEVVKRFKDFNSGDSFESYYSSNLIRRYDNGVMLSVPLGLIFSNPILSNIGPRIPIKLRFSGEVEADVVTSIKQYGINSVLLEMGIEIVVKEKVAFPFSSEYIDVFLNLPLVIELISGKVPENYLNNEKFDIIE